eukprot:8265219-Pyramimonas_sp.AAC.1
MDDDGLVVQYNLGVMHGRDRHELTCSILPDEAGLVGLDANPRCDPNPASKRHQGELPVGTRQNVLGRRPWHSAKQLDACQELVMPFPLQQVKGPATVNDAHGSLAVARCLQQQLWEGLAARRVDDVLDGLLQILVRNLACLGRRSDLALLFSLELRE